MGTTSTEDSKRYTMTELRDSGKPLYVKNLTPLLWTLHEGSGPNRIDIELKPAGSPDSITYLSPAALELPSISRNIAKGKISVSPDFEEEMIELATGTKSARTNLLDEFKVTIVPSAQDKAIDGQDKLDELMANVDRKRVTVQGQQSVTGGSVLDDFINPKPFKAEDGRTFDPRTGEFLPEADAAQLGEQDFNIKSVTVTRPAALPQEN